MPAAGYREHVQNQCHFRFSQAEIQYPTLCHNSIARTPPAELRCNNVSDVSCVAKVADGGGSRALWNTVVTNTFHTNRAGTPTNYKRNGICGCVVCVCVRKIGACCRARRLWNTVVTTLFHTLRAGTPPGTIILSPIQVCLRLRDRGQITNECIPKLKPMAVHGGWGSRR